MFRFIKNLFNGILAFLSGLLKGEKQQKQAPVLEQAKPEQAKSDSPQPQSQPTAATNSQPPAQGSFFLEADEARGYNSPNGGPSNQSQEAKQSAPQPASASALNLPQPKVTSYRDFSNFGDRRRPGANMSSFLEMARKVRTSS